MSDYEDPYAHDEEQMRRRDRDAAGYECPKCGYNPTFKELTLGVCPSCRDFDKGKSEKKKSGKK